jgi:prepilin-type N-terminal cleavage/methylation domain-containing protein
MNKNGFTLVELSIALVIVGLLIGGLLIGQSLMNAAKVRRVITEVQSYDAALALFRTRYKGQIPGDSLLYGGTGDGHLRNSNLTINSISDDVALYWQHLQRGVSFYKNKTTFRAASGLIYFNTVRSRLDSPIIQLDKEAGVAVANCAIGSNNTSWYNCVGSTNGLPYAYFIADWKGIATTFPLTWGRPAATPALIFAIDAKIDDGLALNGFVQSRLAGHPSDVATYGGDCTNYNGTTWSNGTNQATATYNVDNGAVVCHLAITVGATMNVKN